MNPASFQNMGGPGMVPQGHPGASQPQQRGGITHQAVQQQIFRLLSSQQPQQNSQGWQATVPIHPRVQIIYQLVTSLRLIKPLMTINEAVQVAITFEQRTLFDSPDKAAYDQQCRQKIGEIAQTRSKIATSVQQQVQNGQPPMNLGQPQARMQGMAPNPDQVQMQQRFPNGQIPRPSQPPTMGMPNQQQHLAMGNPQTRTQAVPPNMPQMVPPAAQFTPQDLQEISQLAQHMAQNTPPDQLNHIRTRLENIPQRQQILAQGLDPLTHWFKQQATRRYIDMRRAQAQQNRQLIQAPNAVNPEQPRPMSQHTAHTQGPQAPAASTPQNFDPGFMGNVDQIIARQQNAQRLAEAGHAVVPASNVQAMGEQQRSAIRGTPQQPNQPNATRPPQTPNVSQQPQAFWNAQGQQPAIQPAGQPQNQSQLNPFPNVATPIPAHLQGQVGGLNTPIGRMQPQNTNMPNLTRGVGPQSQTPQPQSVWPQQGTPQMQNTAQGTPPNPQQINMNGAPQRPRPPPGKMNNAQLQEYLNTLSETDKRTFIMHLQQRAAASGLPSAGRPESVPMQTQRSQAGPASSQPTSRLPGHAFKGTQQANEVQQQQVPARQPGQMPRPPQQPGDAAQMARQRQQAALANGSLTPDMERTMDRYPYPPGILNANNALSKLPPTVKAWGQLKAWVKDNAGSLPPGSEVKLRGLQGLHYHSLSQRQQQNQQQPGMQPTAQMMPRPNPQPVSAQSQMPNMPLPTIQELQTTRSKFPQLQSATDEQVRNFIMRQRHDALARARQPALNPQAQMQFMQERQHQIQLQQQQQQQQNQALQPGVQPSQAPQGQAGPQKPQPQQPKKVPQSKEQSQEKAPQAPMQGQASNKGVKRGSSDDVVEVPDPKIAQQQQRSQAAKSSQKPSAPSMRPEQAAQTVQKQKDGQGTEQRAKQAQSTQAQQGNQVPNNTQGQQKSEENIQIEAILRKLIDEVTRNTPPRQPVPMDLVTRDKMIPKLAQAQAMLVRLDTALPLFYRMFGGEDNTRELIRTRFLLKAQYNEVNQPINNFTISSEELDKSYNMLYRSFTHIMTRVAQEKEKAEKAKGSATQDSTQGPQPPQQPAKQQPPVLSAANLQQHQHNMQAERQASVQKSHNNNSNRAPPAPTSDKPPYTFGLGAQSPHGIPVYGPNELTQDNLKLPINKKRKTNNQPTSSASTPAQQAGTPLPKPSPQVKTAPSPEAQRLPAPTMYRCIVPKCSSGTVGFTSQSELDKHHVDVHQPKEPVIDDPLQFALEQMRFALNLDENGKAKPKADGAAIPASVGASAMKKSSSMQGTPAMKQETATRMSRVPTYTGPSPASHLLKTPQASSNIKTPVSETKSLSKDSVAAKAPTPLIVTEDPWADSLIQQDTIREAFSGLSSLNGPKAWTKIQDYHFTPESMSSDNNTSPRPSDISENDLVKINMDMSVDDKSWIPVNWSDPMMTELEELDLGGENWAGGVGAGADMMDWETMFGETGEEAQEKARVAQRKYMRDPHGPTEEWLKVYGPMWGVEG